MKNDVRIARVAGGCEYDDEKRIPRKVIAELALAVTPNAVIDIAA